MSSDLIRRIQTDLKPLDAYWCVMYGSATTEKATSRSDIDVAVITQKYERSRNITILQSIIYLNQEPYDIKVFELLPLYIQIQIVHNYVVIFGDSLEVSEYFYFRRKIWKDMEKRYLDNQFSSIAEQKEGIERGKRISFQP